MTVIEAIAAGKGGAGMKAVTQGGLKGLEQRRDRGEEGDRRSHQLVRAHV